MTFHGTPVPVLDPVLDPGPDRSCAVLRGRDDVHAWIRRICFKTGPPGPVGIESEWHVVDAARPAAAVPVARTRAALADLPLSSAVTYEPGGQLELSAPPGRGAAAAVDLLAADLARVRAALAEEGLVLLGVGVDPLRPPARQLEHPRYAAMEAFFDTGGPDGRVMMGSTAAVQVCLDAGADAEETTRRWRLANDLVPVLVAAFANSPLRLGRPTGWRSTRQATWARMDPGRCRCPQAGKDPAACWADYALDARVMLLRRRTGPWLADPGLTFGDWVDGGSGHPPPTADDLAYHLSTLFPPVRPRGWFELRCVDALPDRHWPVAVALTATLLDDPAATGEAERGCAPVRELATAAARDGLADPRLAAAARTCFAAAAAALAAAGDGGLADAVAAYAGRYVARGRTPADDVLDVWRTGGMEALLRAEPPTEDP